MLVAEYSRQLFTGTWQLSFCSSLPVSDPLQVLVFKSASITYQLSSSSAGNCPSLLWLSFLKGSLIIFQWERPLSAAWISVVSVRISRSRREPKPDWLPFFAPQLSNTFLVLFYFILLSCMNKEKVTYPFPPVKPVHVYRLWEEPSAPGENPHRHWENIQTLHRNARRNCGCYETSASLNAQHKKMYVKPK